MINNAPWLGFLKTEESKRSLGSLVKWNILYIIVVTLWKVIVVRQYNYRASRGRPTTRAFFMFPSITRKDADKDLENCLKYLANYGFYKFGVEVSIPINIFWFKRVKCSIRTTFDCVFFQVFEAPPVFFLPIYFKIFVEQWPV